MTPLKLNYQSRKYFAKKLKQRQGYSLVELMVVVAIIGIMALVSVPAFNTYRSKAIQKEGFGMLMSYSIEAKNRYVEYSRYPGNLVGTSYAPHGALTYRLRVENNPSATIHQELAESNIENDVECIATWSECTCNSFQCPEYRKTWTEKPAGIIGSNIGPGTIPIACPPLNQLGVTDDSFSVRVSAVINLSSYSFDSYGINDQKEMIMCENGL